MNQVRAYLWADRWISMVDETFNQAICGLSHGLLCNGCLEGILLLKHSQQIGLLRHDSRRLKAIFHSDSLRMITVSFLSHVSFVFGKVLFFFIQ